MSKKINHVRHGDVLLTRVSQKEYIEATGKTVAHSGKYVLALGEVTGHKHVLTAPTKEALEVKETPAQVVYMKLDVEAPLKHEEHKTVEVPSGFWKMTFEREHDYMKEETRQVID